VAATLVFGNQKGGTGKTTTLVNIAGVYLLRDLRVLVVDVDPQAQAAKSFLARELDAGEPNLGLLLQDDGAASGEVVSRDDIPNLGVLFGRQRDMEHAERALLDPMRSDRLAEILAVQAHHWDRILIDTRPSIGPLTTASLVAADAAIAVAVPEPQGVEGPLVFRRQAELTARKLNRRLRYLGYILNAVDNRRGVTQSVRADLAALHDDLDKTGQQFRTELPRSVDVAGAYSLGIPLAAHEPNHRLSLLYGELVNEIDNRLAATPGVK
jgi:chromosome partitioning protein